MALTGSFLIGQLSVAAHRALSRLDVLALFPLAALTGVWLGLADLVTLTAFVLPALLALKAIGRSASGARVVQAGHALFTGRRDTLAGRDTLLAALEHAAAGTGRDTACILLQIDDWDRLIDRWGADAAEEIALRCGERLATALRQNDLVARLGDARYGVVLHPVQAARLGTRDALAGRLRAVVSEPIAIDGTTVRVTACAGHSSLLRDRADTVTATLAAAEAALTEAHRTGPNAVRAYAPGLLRQRSTQATLATEVETALSEGQIRPWFQPQVCTGTGVISGFEALARWHHPDRGVLTPDEFLPAVEDAGRMDAMGHRVLFHALDALRCWDASGLRVPSVSVNFSAGELRNPALADHVKWEVDRFELRPGRLTVEILETVAATSEDDDILSTIAALRSFGIGLDLDDFGIGQASLSAIRRFGVTRIKIDRTFIHGLDADPEQQATVSAILAMARHLGVETLAEGVDSRSVRSLLMRLGCDHLQGFHIAQPMPFDETVAWATQHNKRIAPTLLIDRQAG